MARGSREPGQRRGARGTVGHAYSALNLRLVLAGFGVLVSAVTAVGLFLAGRIGYGLVVTAIGVVALVNLVVVQRRRIERRRALGPRRWSLFE